MKITISHITLEVPVADGTVMSIRSDYKTFLSRGVGSLRKMKAIIPLNFTDDQLVKIMDAMISTCARACTLAALDDSEDDDKEELNSW